MKSQVNRTEKVKDMSVCCNAEVCQWFGNVAKVLVGAPMPEPTLLCFNCSKPTTKNV